MDILEERLAEIESARKHRASYVHPTIEIDSIVHRPVNSYSRGPGEIPHIYVLESSCVRRVGDSWFMELEGCSPYKVEVKVF